MHSYPFTLCRAKRDRAGGKPRRWAPRRPSRAENRPLGLRSAPVLPHWLRRGGNLAGSSPDATLQPSAGGLRRRFASRVPEGWEASASREHFFVRNDVPYLAVFVTHGLEPPASVPAAPGKAANRKSGWRSQLSASDLPLFNALRECRSKRAGRVGISPYMVCSNKQLASMINARPRSLSKLGAIDGIGRAKLEKYGQDLLAMLARPRGDSADIQDPGPAGSLTEPSGADGGGGT